MKLWKYQNKAGSCFKRRYVTGKKLIWKSFEYIKLLEGAGKPSEKFWKLEKCIKKDKTHCGVLIEMRKQNLPFDLVSLIRDGAIGLEDIECFSDDLQEIVRFLDRKINNI